MVIHPKTLLPRFPLHVFQTLGNCYTCKKKLCQTDTQCEAGGLLQCNNLGVRRYWTSDPFYHLEMETLAHKDEVVIACNICRWSDDEWQ